MTTNQQPTLFPLPSAAVEAAIAALLPLRDSCGVMSLDDAIAQRAAVDLAVTTLCELSSATSAPPAKGLTGGKSIPAAPADFSFALGYVRQLADTSRRIAAATDCPIVSRRERRRADEWERLISLISGNAGKQPDPGERSQEIPVTAETPSPERGTFDFACDFDDLKLLSIFAMRGVEDGPERSEWTVAHRFAAAVASFCLA